MPVHPLIVIALAAFATQVARALPRAVARPAWICAVAGAFVWMLIIDVRAYPAFGYCGYETLGSQWLGSVTRGYRNIVQVTNDGTEDALRWCTEHVPDGQRVLFCSDDQFIADSFINRTQPRYQVVPYDKAENDFDYVIAHHVRGTRYIDDPLECHELGQLHAVHTVWRGRGLYRLPVVTIFRR
jgi:hypothetical protein